MKYKTEKLRKFFLKKDIVQICQGLVIPEKVSNQEDREIYQYVQSKIATGMGFDLTKKEDFLEFKNNISSCIESKEAIMHFVYKAIYDK